MAAIVLIFGTLAFVAWRVVAVTFYAFKCAAIAAAVLGALRALSDTTLPVLGDIIGAVKSLSFDSVWWPYVEWGASNWIVFALLIVMWELVGQRVDRSERAILARHQRLYMATVLTFRCLAHDGLNQGEPVGKYVGRCRGLGQPVYPQAPRWKPFC